jgi:DNA-binding IclR family transcriptional regulator
MSARLPHSVRALIRDHISSVGELELLLTLRSDPERAWSTDALCEALGCPVSWAEQQLDAMAAAGLAKPVDGGWRFAPAAPELARATDALDEAYRTHTRAVVRFIFAVP